MTYEVAGRWFPHCNRGHSPLRQSIAILLHQQIYLSIIYQKEELRRGIKSNEGLLLLLCWPCCVLKIQPFLFFGVFCKSFTPSLVNGLKHLFPNSVPWLFHFGGKLSRMRSEKWAKWAAGRSCLKRPCCSENGHGHNWTAGSTTQHWKCLAPTMWCHSSKIYLFTADTAFVLFSSKSWELIDTELQAWPHLNCPRLYFEIKNQERGNKKDKAPLVDRRRRIALSFWQFVSWGRIPP